MAMHDWSVTRMESAAVDMTDVLEREPQLGDFGFGVFDPRSKTPEAGAAPSGGGPDLIARHIHIDVLVESRPACRCC
jgi:hypothetical protein